jgi:hypothetical protein
MREHDIPPDSQKEEAPDLALLLREEPAPVDVKSFGQKLSEIIAKALKASRGRRAK